MVYKLIIESLSIFMLMSKWIVAIIIIYPFYSYFFAILFASFLILLVKLHKQVFSTLI